MKVLNTLNTIRKRTILLGLGVVYLSILVVFGIVYWKIANKSSGEYFIFQNDINISTKIIAFKKLLKINIYNKKFDNAIKDLISSEENKRPIVKFSNDKNNKFYIFTFDESLGGAWADYYYLLLQGKGITHIKIDKSKEDDISSRFNTYKLEISLYKTDGKDTNENYSIYRNSDKEKLHRVETISLWVKDYPTLQEELFTKNYYYPLNFYFTNLMENSISFPDNAPIILKGVANGSFKYPIWNFLYFSAVTITTLGYGDILPNSTMVRILVMFETISGVVIIGMFVSCLFWNRKS
jgi:hypothetical protein